MSGKLSNLKSGNSAKILAISDFQDVNRLKAMGLVTGQDISVLKSGNPFVLSVAGLSIGIGKDVADCIFVEQLS